jgi:hypothetical protein
MFLYYCPLIRGFRSNKFTVLVYSDFDNGCHIQIYLITLKKKPFLGFNVSKVLKPVELRLKGTVQWQLRWVKIGINRSNMTSCLADKCSLPCPNGHHHARSINFSASLVHFNTIPTGWVSKHYNVGLILLNSRNSDAVAAQRRSIPKCAVKTSAVIITTSVCPKMFFLSVYFNKQ